MAEDEGFLHRWSRRKADARERPAEEPKVREPAADEPDEAQIVARLPDLDSLGAGSDFTPFMHKGVPAALRTAALRRLWRSKPELANVDGLVDYGEDFTDANRALAGLKTIYKVGKGMLEDRPQEEQPPADVETAALDEEPPSEPADDDKSPHENETRQSRSVRTT